MNNNRILIIVVLLIQLGLNAKAQDTIQKSFIEEIQLLSKEIKINAIPNSYKSFLIDSLSLYTAKENSLELFNNKHLFTHICKDKEIYKIKYSEIHVSLEDTNGNKSLSRLEFWSNIDSLIKIKLRKGFITDYQTYVEQFEKGDSKELSLLISGYLIIETDFGYVYFNKIEEEIVNNKPYLFTDLNRFLGNYYGINKCNCQWCHRPR